MTIEQRLRRLIHSIDAIDVRFLAVNSEEDWVALWRRIHAEDREYPEHIDVGGEA